MSFLSDTLDFEKFQLSDMWKQIKKDPWRILVGAGDPINTKLWNEITGKDMEPFVNQWGGATNDRFVRAKEKGINIEPSQQGHGLAKQIAQIYTGKWAGGKLGGGADPGAESGGFDWKRAASNIDFSGQGGQGGGHNMELVRLMQQMEEDARRREAESEMMRRQIMGQRL